MTTIDFSSKHSVLIRHLDASVTPMDVPYYEAEQIGDGAWKIVSSGDCHYLLLGQEHGAAIDTGYGAGNLRAYLAGLCGRDVPWVINTHHHFDHTANNCYFDLAYMGREAVDRATIPYPSFEGISFPRDYPKQVVGDGDLIPLKGRELEIFRIGDHTEDGIAILDRKGRMLFTGDEIMPGMKALNGGVKKWKADLEKLLAHRGEFDRIFGGSGELPVEQLDIFHQAACRILAGEPSDPALTRQPPQFPEERDEQGRVIYDCKLPHPEDHPAGGFFLNNPNVVDYFWRGMSFSYDKTMLTEG